MCISLKILFYSISIKRSITWRSPIFFFSPLRFMRRFQKALQKSIQQSVLGGSKKEGPRAKVILLITFFVSFVVAGSFALSPSFSLFPTQNINPKEILQKKWPPCALLPMLTLVEETPTHHRHYLRPQDLASLSANKRIVEWISAQFSQKRSRRSSPFSCFLVHPNEILLFLTYIDLMMHMASFDVIDYDLAKNWFVIAFHFPFKKRELGLSFFKDPLTHLLTVKHAPCLKVIFRKNNTLATLYPVPLSNERESFECFSILPYVQE